MKIIDLLNKIAKGEEVPKKIKYNNCVYIYNTTNRDGLSFCNEKEDDIEYRFLINMVNDLTDEVEVIEEYKKIEKINISYHPFNCELLLDNEKAEDGQREILAKKINELIDEVNKLKEE